MKRYLWSLLAFLCFFVSISTAQTKTIETTNQNLPKINLSPRVVQVAGVGCPTDDDRFSGVASDVYVRVDNVSDSIESKDFKYTVSGGQIRGEGKSLFWNLKGAKQGTHKITLEISDNGKIKTDVQTIEVVEVECCGGCECAIISMNSSSTEIKKGETVRFQIVAQGGSHDKDDLSIIWNVVGGKILDGQGTTEIIVEADLNNKTELTATVEVSGLCSFTCPNSSSVTVKIKDK